MKPKPVPQPNAKDMKPRRWVTPPVTLKKRRNRLTGRPYVEVVNSTPAPRPWEWGE